MTTSPEIKSFSQALPILERHGMTPMKSAQSKLWQVGVQTLDKGGVIALARELAAQDALAPIEQQALAHYEQVISAGIQTFIAVGEALAEIREGKLYRAAYATFEDYCKGRWGIGASRARQLIGAAETYAAIESVTTVTVANEAQLRPLAGLPPDEQRQAWQQAETATGGKVTAKAVQQAVETIKPKPVPIMRVADSELFDRAEQTSSIAEGYLNRGKIKRPFEYDGKLWIEVGGMYNPHGDDVSECVRVVLVGEPYEPGEENRSFRKNSYTGIQASAGGKQYELTGQWLIISKPLAFKQQIKQEATDTFEDARARFAVLGYKLERHGAWFKLSKPDGSHYATTPDLAPHLDTLRTFEAGAVRRAAQAQQPAIPDDIRAHAAALGLLIQERDGDVLLSWPGEDTSHFAMQPPETARYFLDHDAPRLAAHHAERLGWVLHEQQRAGQALFFCRRAADGKETAEYADELLAYGEALRISGRGPASAQAATPPCERCGQPATDKRAIGGLLAWRCATCAALAEGCERAETLGATIDYTATREDGRMKVLPPEGYQQVWLWCDAAEVGQLCDSWERHASAVLEAPPAQQAIDWDAIKRRAHALLSATNATEAWEYCRSIAAILAQCDRRAFAVKLLQLLAPLIVDRQSDDPAGLAVAIDDLNACDEGTEGLYWARVGCALLDVEPPQS